MKKITILALHLGYGGIERAIGMLANSLIENYEITIVSTYKIYNEPPFKFDERIKIEYLIEDMVPNKKEFYNSLKKLNFIETFKQGLKSIKILKLKKEKMINYIKNCNSDI